MKSQNDVGPDRRACGDMRFSESFLEEIKTRLSISQVVGRAVAWDRKKSAPAKETQGNSSSGKADT